MDLELTEPAVRRVQGPIVVPEPRFELGRSCERRILSPDRTFRNRPKLGVSCVNDGCFGHDHHPVDARGMSG